MTPRFRAPLALAVAAGLSACGSAEDAEGDASATGAAPSGSELALAAMDEVERWDHGELWPGFDPADFPIMIYASDSTFLFGHPSPPSEFEEGRREGMWVLPERHSTVVASTVVELEGVLTASVMAEADRSQGMVAAEAAHEAFHVFQAEEYPEWGANPAALFTYPADRYGPLAERRLETRALQRALASEDLEDLQCWTETAFRIREGRFAEIPPEAADYERGIERLEGTAFHVEHNADGRTPEDAALPDEGFPPAAVRQRALSNGLVLALLLDRVDAQWQGKVHSDPSVFLGDLLARALPGEGDSTCRFENPERDAALANARADVRTLEAERQEVVRQFEEREGWRIRVKAPSPLLLQELDPMNVGVVGSLKVLHERMLRLENDAATVEVLGRSALTEGVGPNPVFDGVRVFQVTGLEEEPDVSEMDGGTRIEADGLEIELRQGELTHSGRSLEIELGT